MKIGKMMLVMMALLGLLSGGERRERPEPATGEIRGNVFDSTHSIVPKTLK